jgi:hypothetical protein
MLRGRGMRQIDLPNGRQRCKRNRDAECHHEGQESQTWSHRNSPPGNQGRTATPFLTHLKLAASRP